MKFQNISSKVVQNFLKFSQNFQISQIVQIIFAKFSLFFQQIIINFYFYNNLLRLKKLDFLNCHKMITVMYYFNHCKNSVLDLTKKLVNFLKYGYICLIPAKYQIELFLQEISYN